MEPRFTVTAKLTLYVVKTNPDGNSPHHGLHTNTSPHVVTFQPSAGDEIIYTLPGNLDTEYEWREVRGFDGHAEHRWVIVAADALLWNVSKVVPRPKTNDQGSTYWVEHVAVSLGSHPGRACSLGEDGLEDAFGRPVVEDLLFEHVAAGLGIPGGRDWRYAPAEATEEDARRPTSRRLNLSIEFEDVDNGSGWREYKTHSSVWDKEDGL